MAYSYTSATHTGNNGQITRIQDNTGTQEAGRTVDYTYDEWARLKTAQTTGSASYPQWGLSWDYDRFGNRKNQNVTAGSAPAPQLSINPNTNRINSPGYAYDSSGNLTNDAVYNYTYDGENRIIQVKQGSTVLSTSSYDGASLRVKKVAGSTTTRYIFSGTKVIAEYVNGAAPSAPTREYVYSGSALLATIEGGATKYHHQDHLSVRLNTDSTGTLIGQQGNYPYGEAWYSLSTTTKWRFTSYERDYESANDYAVFRYYVNRLGRFETPDPMPGSQAGPQSLNRYAYVLGDPVNRTDPLGLLSTLDVLPPCGHEGPVGTPPTFGTYGPGWLCDFLPSWFPGCYFDPAYLTPPFLPPGTAYADRPEPNAGAPNEQTRICPAGFEARFDWGEFAACIGGDLQLLAIGTAVCAVSIRWLALGIGTRNIGLIIRGATGAAVFCGGTGLFVAKCVDRALWCVPSKNSKE